VRKTQGFISRPINDLYPEPELAERMHFDSRMSESKPESTDAPGSKGRLLVVEDEAFIRFALEDYFTMRGYTVDAAGEWEEAEALLATRPYAIVITDLRLTGFGGTEGLEIVGFVHQRFPATRLILLTGFGSAEVEAEARRRGVDAFLHKPMALADLARIADSMIAAKA
jgi:DNA-binding NtrC family response regulator